MLAELITRSQNYGIETAQSGNTNHLPMALIALNKLGANQVHLEAYYANYAPSLITRNAVNLNPAFIWDEQLGDKSAFDDYLAYFLLQVESKGVEETLNDHLDRLMRGCGASAFHAIIRLSYGLQADNEVEVAFGLADLASNYLPIEEPKSRIGDYSTILNAALKVYEGINVDGSLISDRMNSVVINQNFQQVNWVPESNDLTELSKLVADLYILSRDFTVLHAVTSCHAMRYLIPFIKQPTQALNHYWAAIVSAVLSVENLTRNESQIFGIKQPFELNYNVVLNSQDSHVIKLAWACLDEFQFYGHESHLLILNAMLGES